MTRGYWHITLCPECDAVDCAPFNPDHNANVPGYYDCQRESAGR